MTKRSRDFVITIFNYEDKLDFIKKFFGCAQYFCMGEEECPTTKKLHLQGYIYFSNARSFSGLLKMIQKSSIGRNFKLSLAKEKDIGWQQMYCMKEGKNWFEIGSKPEQGKRKDLSSTRQELLRHGKMRKIVENCENFQQIRVCEKYLSYKEKRRDFKPLVIWLWGGTGLGKSRIARKICDPEDTWCSSGALQWFDRYDAHKDCIFDEFRGSSCSYSYLLRLLDRYEMNLPVKGGFRQFLAKKIIITSHKSPWDCYSGLDEGIEQLIRRIDIIRNIERNDTDVLTQKSGVILNPDFCAEISRKFQTKTQK